MQSLCNYSASVFCITVRFCFTQIDGNDGIQLALSGAAAHLCAWTVCTNVFSLASSVLVCPKLVWHVVVVVVAARAGGVVVGLLHYVWQAALFYPTGDVRC